MRVRRGPVAAAAIALGVFVGLTATDSDPSEPDATTGPEPTAITSDAPDFATLAALVGASDLVVRGHVVSTDHGRVFGEPGATAIESRLVVLELDEVLHRGDDAPSDLAAGASITVEEPGWLEDGTPLIVDGVPPTSTGDDVIWFLDAVPSLAQESSRDEPAYVLVGPQGHYRVDDDDLIPSEDDDPLSTNLASLGAAGLVDAIEAPDRAAITTTVP